MTEKIQPAPTHDEIRRLLGPIDDAKLAAIEATGATMAQLEQVVAWACGESDVMAAERLPLSGVVAQVYEILTVDEPDDEERA